MIELAPHQREAVERIVRLLARFRGAILADEVGLGKSFVAAAVAASAGEDVEVIVPASLVRQWRETLADFGVHAPVITHDSLLGDRFVPQPRRHRLLIVDEAHGFRNSVTLRYAALARRSIGSKLLLVTATPICNSPDDLFSLIALIAADDSLQFAGVPSIEKAFRAREAGAIRAIIAELVIRRDRGVLPEKWQFGSLDRHVIRHPVPAIAEIDSLRFPLIAGHGALLRRVLWRRLESSEAALLESVRRQTRFYERALDCLRSGRTLTKREYRRAFGDEEDRGAQQEVLFWDVFAPDTARIDAEEIRDEIHRLDRIRDTALAAPRTKRDLLAAVCRPVEEPILIFTSAVATALDIAGALPAGVITSRGARPIDALDAFQRGDFDILVSTDLGSEGLNLQRAGVVVHYDIPWNPVKLDQRNGRAWRVGQPRSAVQAVYFIPETRRTGIIETVASKNRARRRLLDLPLPGESDGVRGSLRALPPHLPRDAPAVALIRKLQASRIAIPSGIARRYRAGVERLMSEMSREYLDERRLAELLALLEADEV